MRFKIRQQIVCISRQWEQINNLDFLQRIGLKSKKAIGPKYNEIVTVEAYHIFCVGGMKGVILQEYQQLTNGKRNSYEENQFEPILDDEHVSQVMESINQPFEL